VHLAFGPQPETSKVRYLLAIDMLFEHWTRAIVPGSNIYHPRVPIDECVGGKRDFLRTMTPALLTDGLRIEGGI
jgi:hypothetical protein